MIRIETKCPDSVTQLQADLDLQDIVVLNLTRAIQLCVDIGAHLIAGSDEQAPSNMGDTFNILEKMKIISPAISSSMKKVVGFRNVAVHGYDKLDLEIVHGITSNRLEDFKRYAKAISAITNS